MAFKMRHKDLHGVVDELNNASKMHAKQAKVVENHIDEMNKASSTQKMMATPMKNAFLSARNNAIKGGEKSFEFKGETYPVTGDKNSTFDKSPYQKKTKKRSLTASCIAAAKRKFKVYPSAYANMWASSQQRQGKC